MNKIRSDKGLIRLNERDLVSLRWIGGQYAIRLDTLQILLGRLASQSTKEPDRVQESTARRVVARWEQENLVGRRKFFFAQPDWIWLTGRGLHQMDLPYKPWTPKVSQLNHLHDVNRVRLRVEQHYGSKARWRGERQLRIQYRDRTGWHVSDGEVITQGGAVIAVEVELTQKSRKRVDEIVGRLAEQYDRVWYFVNDATRPVITAATRSCQDMVRLYDIEEVRE